MSRKNVTITLRRSKDDKKGLADKFILCSSAFLSVLLPKSKIFRKEVQRTTLKRKIEIKEIKRHKKRLGEFDVVMALTTYPEKQETSETILLSEADVANIQGLSENKLGDLSNSEEHFIAVGSINADHPENIAAQVDYNQYHTTRNEHINSVSPLPIEGGATQNGYKVIVDDYQSLLIRDVSDTLLAKFNHVEGVKSSGKKHARTLVKAIQHKNSSMTSVLERLMQEEKKISRKWFQKWRYGNYQQLLEDTSSSLVNKSQYSDLLVFYRELHEHEMTLNAKFFGWMRNKKEKAFIAKIKDEIKTTIGDKKPQQTRLDLLKTLDSTEALGQGKNNSLDRTVKWHKTILQLNYKELLDLMLSNKLISPELYLSPFYDLDISSIEDLQLLFDAYENKFEQLIQKITNFTDNIKSSTHAETFHDVLQHLFTKVHDNDETISIITQLKTKINGLATSNILTSDESPFVEHNEMDPNIAITSQNQSNIDSENEEESPSSTIETPTDQPRSPIHSVDHNLDTLSNEIMFPKDNLKSEQQNDEESVKEETTLLTLETNNNLEENAESTETEKEELVESRLDKPQKEEMDVINQNPVEFIGETEPKDHIEELENTTNNHLEPVQTKILDEYLSKFERELGQMDDNNITTKRTIIDGLYEKIELLLELPNHYKRRPNKKVCSNSKLCKLVDKLITDKDFHLARVIAKLYNLKRPQDRDRSPSPRRHAQEASIAEPKGTGQNEIPLHDIRQPRKHTKGRVSPKNNSDSGKPYEKIIDELVGKHVTSEVNSALRDFIRNYVDTRLNMVENLLFSKSNCPMTTFMDIKDCALSYESEKFGKLSEQLVAEFKQSTQKTTADDTSKLSINLNNIQFILSAGNALTKLKETKTLPPDTQTLEIIHGTLDQSSIEYRRLQKLLGRVKNIRTAQEKLGLTDTTSEDKNLELLNQLMMLTLKADDITTDNIASANDDLARLIATKNGIISEELSAEINSDITNIIDNCNDANILVAIDHANELKKLLSKDIIVNKLNTVGRRISANRYFEEIEPLLKKLGTASFPYNEFITFCDVDDQNIQFSGEKKLSRVEIIATWASEKNKEEFKCEIINVNNRLRDAVKIRLQARNWSINDFEKIINHLSATCLASNTINKIEYKDDIKKIESIENEITDLINKDDNKLTFNSSFEKLRLAYANMIDNVTTTAAKGTCNNLWSAEVFSTMNVIANATNPIQKYKESYRKISETCLFDSPSTELVRLAREVSCSNTTLKNNAVALINAVEDDKEAPEQCGPLSASDNSKLRAQLVLLALDYKTVTVDTIKKIDKELTYLFYEKTSGVPGRFLDEMSLKIENIINRKTNNRYILSAIANSNKLIGLLDKDVADKINNAPKPSLSENRHIENRFETPKEASVENSISGIFAKFKDVLSVNDRLNPYANQR